MSEKINQIRDLCAEIESYKVGANVDQIGMAFEKIGDLSKAVRLVCDELENICDRARLKNSLDELYHYINEVDGDDGIPMCISSDAMKVLNQYMDDLYDALNLGKP